METGASVFATPATMPPGPLARLLEEHGHTALYFAEHTHAVAGAQSARMPHKFRETLDPFVAATAAACATRSLRVGSAICLVAQHDPLVLAKTVASVDHLSGGRVDFGVGAGWATDEMRHHGVDPDRRFARMREHVEAMRAIWTRTEATYTGKHVAFEGVWSWPKPAQWPHPPVMVGGMGPRVLDRVLAYGDAWLPDFGDEDTLASTLRRIPELNKRAEDAGRAPVPVVLAGVPHDPHVLERCERAGVTRVLTLLPAAGRAVIERYLERYELAIAAWRGE
ncbi:N5,N10-methylenetetrahydromethanopterin reductase-related protein [Streptomyces lincolnensis]|uniref:N5,N10-methylenetetrahydromethanopterin reductase-related protein n=1 Tax=Streptomyces lincolnensis TaxID=1915 RepID=A0A1B1MFB0_STRLN|nr:TIGR03619 family F420-dependent LLM class oxidoreductase [Streptomyces lincolnensis]ANS67320.1 N5,N10-methylenetetrahydromethanopterin reductase-related protein [Streptomyces lincolnensis]AXG56191.1 N5,N10-methylenetetrahydromethanopterin reductase-related protein [Streptomyces lincolnensis]QMV07346.1 TIGR03619 family F420-dependent LLM class oxidoreductase [Streptomyces lincolnensis]